MSLSRKAKSNSDSMNTKKLQLLNNQIIIFIIIYICFDKNNQKLSIKANIFSVSHPILTYDIILVQSDK